MKTEGVLTSEMLWKVIAVPGRLVPSWISAIGAGVLMSRITDKNPELYERLKELKGRVICFDATDISKKFFMVIKEEDILVLPNFGGKVDVVMKGKINMLFSLLLGIEDPDTVFFSRRLEINGDTAVAIHFKNILNSF